MFDNLLGRLPGRHPIDVSSRTVLITGGAGGIGIEIASAFLDAGSNVIACGRSEERLADARRRLPGLRTHVCDITDPDSIDLMAQWLAEEAGDLDTVINNAAVTHAFDIHDPDAPDAFAADIATNLLGLVNVTWRLLPMIEANPDPCLVNVTSGIAYAPALEVPGYSATKAAVHSFTRVLRFRHGDRVHVVELMPPAVDTEMVAALECPKMAPADVAAALLRGLRTGAREIRMGETHLTHAVDRIWPDGAVKILNRAFDR